MTMAEETADLEMVATVAAAVEEAARRVVEIVAAVLPLVPLKY